MAQQTVPLTLIPQGWFMSWEMFTQAAFNVCATLADSKQTYVDNQCRQSQTFGSLATGYQQVAGTNMALTINIPQSASIQIITNPDVVQDPKGNTVAQGYLIFVEDATDDDFNDFYASIIAWSKSG